ncbi:MAG: FecR domain-containing protein [Deltaproteobacteria bacterium]|nr:FecR domain-containing protein [Deltaproteobacteria bacterium]
MTRCPGKEQLTRAISNDSSAELDAHLMECPVCRDECEKTRKLIEMAKGLPDGHPTSQTVTRIADELRATRPERDLWASARPGYGVVLVAFLLVGAAVFAWNYVFYPPSGPSGSANTNAERRDSPKGNVTASRSAIYTHSIEHKGYAFDEVVSLREGTVTIQVTPLKSNERFMVKTDDATVEVRGTVFTVVATNGRLVKVSVKSGKVHVRPKHADVAILTAGGQWRRRTHPIQKPTAVLPHSPDSGVFPIASPEAASHLTKKTDRLDRTDKTVPAPMKKKETVFQEGWSLLRKKRYAEAANVFDNAVSSSNGKDLNEEIYFWRAAAHYKSNQSEKTGEALTDFMRRYPQSPRMDEARMMYGWHLFNTGRYETAKQEFESVRQSPLPHVRQNAGLGLRRIEARQ